MTKALVSAALAGALILAMSGAASASTVVYSASGSGSDGALSGQATISTGSGLLTVDLSSLEANPISIGQEVSGIVITFASAPPSFSSFTQSGQLISVNSDGTFSDVSGSPSHWDDAVSVNSLYIATAGTGSKSGKPVDLIIGPGTGTAPDYYSNANASIVRAHTPQIQGTGIFTLAYTGPAPLIQSVSIEFGTGPDTVLAGSVPVPEPATWAMLIAGMAMAGGLMRRSRVRLTTA
ncbi:MAG: PEPxxWA-CTERM sorting domain-containing protein [Caulobacteraceae bacterium]